MIRSGRREYSGEIRNRKTQGSRIESAPKGRRPNESMDALVPTSVPGIALSLLAAVAFAVQYLCVRLGAVDGSVRGIVFISLVCNVVLIVPPAFAVYDPTIVLTRSALLMFVLAGLSGSMAARLLMYRSIQAIGASRTSPLVATNVFFATVLAIWILGEGLTALHAAGIVLIVVGVGAISSEMATDTSRSIREVGLAVAIPIAAAIFLGMEPILISIGLAAGTPILTGFAVMALAATSGFGLYLWYDEALPTRGDIESAWFQWAIGAGISSTVGIGSYVAALAVAPVVVVIPLLQTVPLFVLVLAAFTLPSHLERVSRRLVLGAIVVVVGAGVVSVQ